MSELYTHNKTGALYEIVEHNIVNATNGANDQIMIMYRRKGDTIGWKTFVREEKEFFEKFKAVHNKRHERL